MAKLFNILQLPYSDVYDDHANETMVEDPSFRQQESCKSLNSVLRLCD